MRSPNPHDIERYDFHTVHTSMGQVVTKIRRKFGRGAIDEMLRLAELIRDRVPEIDPHLGLANYLWKAQLLSEAL
jgi:hypothetical protein